MDPGESFSDDEPAAGWISPDDRLWRHPSEVAIASARPTRSEPRVWTVAILAGVIASMLTSSLIVAAGGFKKTVVHSVERVSPSVTTVELASTDSTTRIEQIAESIRPDIVQIQVQTDAGSGSGSGVLFRTDGHILTNKHVVEDAKSINVVLADGHETTGHVVGSDTDTDIAVVKIDGVKVGAAPLGSAVNLKVGQSAIAIGEPLGLAGGPSVTVGIISAVGRQVDDKSGPLLDMIQTDAPIAPGSSGGALLDSAGNVVGITTAIAVTDVGAEGLGFATPIDIARDVADQLITTGHVVHVWLGIQGEDLDRNRADSMGLPGGAVVKTVRKDSPAAHAGISPSDVIVAVDGRAVTSMAGLVVALRGRHPGQTITINYRRDNGSTRAARATLVERPANLS